MNFRPRPFKSIAYKKKISQPNFNLRLNQHQYIIYANYFGKINKKILETGRILISRALKRKKSMEKGNPLQKKVKGTSYRYISCTIPITKKGTKSRMGKGKGAIDHYVAFIKQFQPIYCITNIAPYSFLKLYVRLQEKFPIPLKYYTN